MRAPRKKDWATACKHLTNRVVKCEIEIEEVYAHLKRAQDDNHKLTRQIADLQAEVAILKNQRAILVPAQGGGPWIAPQVGAVTYNSNGYEPDREVPMSSTRLIERAEAKTEPYKAPTQSYLRWWNRWFP
jgi:hypothetical protein